MTALPEKLREALKDPDSCTELDLEAKDLASLPAEVGQLANLTGLILRGNKFVSLPAEVGQLANLTELYLNNNQIASLPAEVGQLANLTELSLMHNKIATPPLVLADLPKLQLDLRGNPFLEDPQYAGLGADIAIFAQLAERAKNDPTLCLAARPTPTAFTREAFAEAWARAPDPLFDRGTRRPRAGPGRRRPSSRRQPPS